MLVTGGTRGIGAAIASAFEDAGASLLLTGTDSERVEALNREAGSAKVRYIQTNFLDRESVASFCKEIEGQDRIDVCVNNAGINRIASIDTVATEDFDAVSEVNLRAPYLVSQAASRVMKRANYGRIVNIASIWSVITKAGRSPYSTTKFGLIGMTKATAVDLAPFNILVNAVSPGFVMTDMTRSSLSDEERDNLSSQVPLNRFAEPIEIAKVVLFLASGENTYITGQNIVADGGFVIV